MKTRMSMILTGIFLLASVPVWAAPTTFTMSATVPTGTGIGIIVNQIQGTTWTQITGTKLSFDPLTYDSKNNIYDATYYYALDISVTGGGGSPDVTSTYTEGSNPNGSSNGLGYKSIASFDKEAIVNGNQVETLLAGPMPNIDVVGEHITYEQTAGGWLRIYLGVYTGDPVVTGAQEFTNADAPGKYTGSLAVTAVVD